MNFHACIVSYSSRIGLFVDLENLSRFVLIIVWVRLAEQSDSEGSEQEDRDAGITSAKDLSDVRMDDTYYVQMYEHVFIM